MTKGHIASEYESYDILIIEKTGSVVEADLVKTKDGRRYAVKKHKNYNDSPSKA